MYLVLLYSLNVKDIEGVSYNKMCYINKIAIAKNQAYSTEQIMAHI